jgi:hypothetical protein
MLGTTTRAKGDAIRSGPADPPAVNEGGAATATTTMTGRGRRTVGMEMEDGWHALGKEEHLCIV